MVWVDGRYSWPLILAIVYVTFVIVATDTLWRVVVAPLWQVAACGIAAMAAGVALIVLFAARLDKR